MKSHPPALCVLQLSGTTGEGVVCVQGSVLSNISDLRSSISGGSSWIGHGTAMGPDR
jgi:hypothetical protein